MLTLLGFAAGVLAGVVGLTVLVLTVATRDFWGGDEDG